ncbi:MAG TPA: DinB family protein [Methylomirabilota bacterium]|nr:DinB family protein [Methylomirabilota bacterium]
MEVRDLFLEQHAAMHTAAVGGNTMSAADRAFAGLTEEQMRVRPREDLNSLAWLMWHIARAEDIVVNQVVGGGGQLFDEGWMRRLNVSRHDFGIGMTSPEVTELSQRIDVAALREYRDAVGRRTREVISGFRPEDWSVPVKADAVERAAAAGAFGARTEALVKGFPGRPRSALLSGIALFHCAGHMGEAATVRSAGGFGTGI